LGDIPSYTKLNSHSRQAARILAQPRLKDVPKRERERITHEFIALFLDSRERDLINTMLEIFSDETNPVFQLFYALDKLDPIIATWRYLHTYRGKLDRDAADFLQRMKNFFEYPDVPKIAAGYTRDTALTDLVSALRNEQLAADYYIDRDTIRALRPFGLDTDLALRIIEGVDLIKKK
jgi:hypothetical protein